MEFGRFAELHPQVRDVCFTFYERARGAADDEYSGLMHLWVAFANWMACVTEADNDARMVEGIAGDQRMIEAYDRLWQENAGFQQRVLAFAAHWPIYRSQDIVQHYGRNYPYHFETREEFTASVAHDERIRRSPRGWEAGKRPTWGDLIWAIYQVRCNLMHGHKSMLRLSDRRLVASSYGLLLEFIERSGCFDWY